MNKKFDKKVQQRIEELGYYNCRKAGLSATMKAFYLGIGLEPSGEFVEVANELEIPKREIVYWEALWYRKDSWFNQAL